MEVIGGADKYMAACRDCHENNIEVMEEEREKLNQQHNRKVLNSVENLTNGVYRTKENVFA